MISIHRLAWLGVLGFVVLVAVAARGQDSSLESLLSDLAGPADRAQALAAQRLPRAGLDAVSGLMDLMSSDDARVSTAAERVLTRIAYSVAAPGRETERKALTDLLLAAVATDRPAAWRGRILKLLTIAAPADQDLTPLAGLLGDEALREPTRAALVEMGTPAAARVLREALEDAEPAFQPAIAQALGRLHDGASLPLLREAMSRDDPALRAAAAVAVGGIGSVADLDHALRVLRDADEATRRDALEAVLRLADIAAADPAAQEIALRTFTSVLDQARTSTETTAAVAGLGRLHDPSTMPRLLELAAEGELPVALAAVNALRSFDTAEAIQTIIGAYTTMPAAIRPAILALLADRASPESVAVIAGELGASDAFLRLAAIDALGRGGQAAAIEPLDRAASELEGAEASTARENLLRLAQRLSRAGDPESAGRAYAVALARIPAQDIPTRRRALRGLAEAPSSDAIDLVLETLDVAELAGHATQALLAGAELLTRQDRKTEALELYGRLRERNPDAATLRAIAQGMIRAGATTDVQRLLGVIAQWHVVGPFDLGEDKQGWQTAYVGEPQVSLAGLYMAGKSRVGWKPVRTEDAQGLMDLRARIADRDHCVGYARAEILVDEPTDALLLLGVDDSQKVWLNGELLQEEFSAHALVIDAIKVPLHLKKGSNELLLKIHQNTQGWEFCARLVDAEGRPLPFTQPAD